MYNVIKNIFFNEGIFFTGVLSFSELTIIAPGLLSKDAEIKSCFVFLVPYNTYEAVTDDLGVSVYARARDYHIYFSSLFERVIPLLEAEFKGERFFGYADHSPINEKLAAANAGLGVIGRNSLLINSEYGSYVFIGEILTTLSLPSRSFTINSCIGCDLCVKACPTNAITDKKIIRERCLSAISQKKVKSEDELSLLKQNKTVWGCDICQTVCPMNNDKLSAVDVFFREGRLSNISEELIRTMPDHVFSNYSFAWKGKGLFLHNIINLRDIDKTY